MKNLVLLFKQVLSSKLFRFLFAGGLNTVFGYLMFSTFEFLTGSPPVSVILANILGILFNFKTYGSIVFNSKDNSLIYRFALVYVIVASLQILFLKLLSLAGVENAYVGGAIILLPMALLSFVLMRKWVFHKKLTLDESEDKPDDIDIVEANKT